MTKFKVGDKFACPSSDGTKYNWGTIDKITITHSISFYHVAWDDTPGATYKYSAQAADSIWELPTQGLTLYQGPFNPPNSQPIPVASVMGTWSPKFKAGDFIKYHRPGIWTKHGLITRVEADPKIVSAFIYHIWWWDNSTVGPVGDKYDAKRADQIWGLETPTIAGGYKYSAQAIEFCPISVTVGDPEIETKVCDHKWIKYHGFSTSYNFCEKCDQKASLDEI